MTYAVYFLRREPGQSWEDAMAALEERAGNGEAPARPEQWDQVVAAVRGLLGDVDVSEGPPDWEIDDPKTAIEVSCFAGQWSMMVPYWWDGEGAAKIAGYLRAIAGIVHDATGLDVYDPQVEEVAMTSDEWTGKAAAVFDQVAESFDRRGITRYRAELP
jgi:hypothetical protein